MSDIVERLHGPDGMEAAQEILRLREENARLREAFKPFILETRPENNVYGYVIVFVKPEQLSAARAALQEGEGND